MPHVELVVCFTAFVRLSLCPAGKPVSFPVLRRGFDYIYFFIYFSFRFHRLPIKSGSTAVQHDTCACIMCCISLQINSILKIHDRVITAPKHG